MPAVTPCYEVDALNADAHVGYLCGAIMLFLVLLVPKHRCW